MTADLSGRKSVRQTANGVLLGCLLMACSNANAFDYVIEGIVKYSSFRNGEFVTSRDRSFRASVSNCLWKISTKLLQSTDFETFELSFDGADIVHYIQYAAGSQKRTNDGVMVVDKGPVPFVSLNTCAEHVWFAYASHCYLAERRGSNTVSPLWWIPKTARAEVPCEWILHERAPFLPKMAIFHDDGYTWANTVNGVERRRRKPPFDSGYARVKYSPAGFTNLGRFAIPTSFTSELYHRRRDRETGVPVVLLGARIEGRATNILAGAALDFKDSITPKVTVVVEDQRLVAAGERQQSTQYLLESNRALPSVAHLRRHYPPMPGERRTSGYHAVLIYSLLGFAIVGPIVLLKVLRKSQKQNGS
jgi:hypothetical protein